MARKTKTLKTAPLKRDDYDECLEKLRDINDLAFLQDVEAGMDFEDLDNLLDTIKEVAEGKLLRDKIDHKLIKAWADESGEGTEVIKDLFEGMTRWEITQFIKENDDIFEPDIFAIDESMSVLEKRERLCAVFGFDPARMPRRGEFINRIMELLQW
ncbi:MAG: hypothetical protein RR382_04735 [Tannerellaceae bacterium]